MRGSRVERCTHISYSHIILGTGEYSFLDRSAASCLNSSDWLVNTRDQWVRTEVQLGIRIATDGR